MLAFNCGAGLGKFKAENNYYSKIYFRITLIKIRTGFKDIYAKALESHLNFVNKRNLNRSVTVKVSAAFYHFMQELGLKWTN